MALPSSGPISLSDVNVELGLSATAQISLNDSVVRTLFGIGSGQIGMSNGFGKANQFAFTISSNQTNANLATLATNAGWNGTTKVVATIGSGIYISSNSTGTPALTVNGTFAGGVELINNGVIAGRGGKGGNSPGGSGGGGGGGAGGGALLVSSAVSITNNGSIQGGGGGGGGGGSNDGSRRGSGGGGGQSGLVNSDIGYGVSNGGAGTYSAPGNGGSYVTGVYESNYGAYLTGGDGGRGGYHGASGLGGGNSPNYYGGGGGGGGYAVSGNSNITWVATGTRTGSIY